jgi:hypothetical protein
MGSSLGIDFGTTHTVAALGTPDGRTQPLLFDSSPLLSSAVFAETGRLLVGQDAERNARLDPTRFEPNPKRRIDDGSILLGADEYPVPDVIAAVLRRVAGEATRAAGAPPAGAVLTYPATWAAQRKAILADAAGRAGLSPVTLVPEPVAAAVYFTTVLGHQVPVGSAVAVYDFGGGTFDTSVLRRKPDGGWEVLVADGLDTVGGLDLDAAVIERIGRTVGASDPARWQRLVNPGSSADQGAADDQRNNRILREDVRAAKEQLSRTSSAVVRVPLFDADFYLSRDEFEAVVRPLLDRTVTLTGETLRRAGLWQGQLAALFLTGGSSRIPMVSTLLHQRVGVAPTMIEQPELVVALGSLASVPGGPRPVASPTSAPPMPVSVPVPGSAPPLSSQPLAGMPVSGTPVPAASVSPGIPVDFGTTSIRETRRWGPFRPRTVVAAGAAAAVLLAIGGGTAYTLASADKPTGGSGTSSNGGRRPTGGTTVARQPGANPGGNTQQNGGGPGLSVPINKTVWYAGLKITLGTATSPATTRGPVVVSTVVENLAGEQASPYAPGKIDLDSGGTHYQGNFTGVNAFPGGAKTNAQLEFSQGSAGPVADLANAVITIGEGGKAQAVVPLGREGTLVTREPKPIAGGNTTLSVHDIRLTVGACELRYDHVSIHKQMDSANAAIACAAEAQYTGGSSRFIGEVNYRLKLPDGSVKGPETNGFPYQALSPQQTVSGTLVFAIKWPAPGGYTIQFLDVQTGGNTTSTAQNTVETPLTLPA